MKPSPLRAPGQCFTSVRVSGLVHSLLLAALVLSVSPAGGQVIPIDWADETLRVQEVVLGGNAALAAARAGTEAARARAVGAGLPVPAVLSGAMEDVRDGYDVTGATFRLEVGREFLTGGRSAAARALAAADVAVAEARLSALDRRLRADVLRELTRVATARGIVRRLAAEDTMLSGAEVSVRDRFSVGEARYVDVLRLRTERLRIQTDRAAVMAEERAALAALAGLSAAEHREEIMRLADMFAVAHGTDPTPRLPPTPAVDSLLLLAGPVVMASTAVERARASRASILLGQRMRFAASIGAQRFVEADGSSVFGPVLGGSITLPFTAGRANRGAWRPIGSWTPLRRPEMRSLIGFGENLRVRQPTTKPPRNAWPCTMRHCLVRRGRSAKARSRRTERASCRSWNS